MPSKILVIGLDGGAWSLYDRLIQQGLMPTLQRLTQTGCRATLNSTIPILTPTAWTSFATGTNPGRHAVLGFMAPQDTPGEYACPLPRSTTVAQPTLWRLLADQGRKPSLLHVPLTYPPEPINANILTGMFTPSPDSPCTQPPALKAELQSLDCLGPFEILLPDPHGHPNLTDDDYEPFFRDIATYTEHLFRAACHLLEKPWDFFMPMFLSNDRFQHALYHRIAALDPAATDPVSQGIRRFYTRLDEILNHLLTAAGPDATTFIMSDHGFGPCLGRFNLGPWFAQQGYLAWRSASHATRHQRLKRFARKTRLNLLLRKLLSPTRVAQLAGAVSPLDWSNTRAFPTVGGIQINLKGREKLGTVDPADYHAFRDELRDKLSRITDPQGRKIFARLHYPEEIYTGHAIPFARDIITENNEDASYEFYLGSPDSPPVEPALSYTGNHRADGIFLAHGPHVAASRANPHAPTANIIDLAPTILWRMGLPIPSHMDGRPLTHVFTDQLPVRYTESEAAPCPSQTIHDLNHDDQAVIQHRLKAIGYLE